MNDKNKGVVLLSSGLDSALLLEIALNEMKKGFSKAGIDDPLEV